MQAVSERNFDKVAAAAKVTFEQLEERRLFAALNLIAVVDAGQNNSIGKTQKSISYYDVTDLATHPLSQTPLFSVWTGYEKPNDYEDPQAITINPANGDTYMLAFDNAANPNTVANNDQPGDYDLYKFNIQAIYNDFITNGRARGVMYAPPTAPDGTAITIHPNYTASTQITIGGGAIQKIGEVARRGALLSGGTPFFDAQQIQYINDNTLLLIENRQTSGNGPINQDFSIRTLERVSTSPGAAVAPGATRPDDTGGYNNGTTQSWESFDWNGDNYVNLDKNDNTANGNLSEVDGMRYINRDGVQGVWISDKDGSTADGSETGGDDFAFFKLNFATRTAQKQEIRTGPSTSATYFELDDQPDGDINPANDDNLGEEDWYNVDSTGRLVISESGFFQNPQVEPRVFLNPITSYDAGDTAPADGIHEVLPGATTASPPIAPTAAQDDDPEITSGQFGVYDEAQNLVYYFDADSGPTDLYAVNPTTGAIVYAELDAANINVIADANRLVAFTFNTGGTPPKVNSGSYVYNEAGGPKVRVTFSSDVSASVQAGDLTFAKTPGGSPVAATSVSFSGNTATFVLPKTIANGNYIATISSAGVFDSNGNLDGNGDGTAGDNYTLPFFFLNGDADHNRAVDVADFTAFFAGFGMPTGATYSQGDFDYNGSVDVADFTLFFANFGQNQPAPAPLPGPAKTSAFSDSPIYGLPDKKTDASGATTTRVADQILV